MNKLGMVLVLSGGLMLMCAATGLRGQSTGGWKQALRTGWSIQSSAKIEAKGEAISSVGFTPGGWYPAAVPSTVMAALVANKAYPDPHFGMNVRSYPGVDYPVGANFSRLAMSEASPFRVSWWYRREFAGPRAEPGGRVWLRFDGLNFRANIWVNGRRVAEATTTAGAWRVHEFDVTDVVRLGQPNALAVEVFPPQADDLAITFVDWNPMPPDKVMGLFREVWLAVSGPVTVRQPHVRTRLELPSLNSAQLTVMADLRNAGSQPVKGALNGQIDKVKFSQPVELAAGEVRTVTFTPEAYPQLTFTRPRVWWPARHGEQHLYPLKLEFVADGRVSDRQEIRFGVRDVSSEFTEQDRRVFKINGQRILIRGAGYTPEMMLRSTPERQEAELRYVLDMNLNAVRLEGKLEDEQFLDVCDRLGILVLAGWCCCDHWENWPKWKDEDYPIAAESLRDQIRRLRHHPSLLAWLNGSDNPPPARVEKIYLDILEKLEWPNPVLSSATQKRAEHSGPSGVKMTGPYEYVPPVYWYVDKTRGGAHGFNTETSPGPAVPPIESLRRMLPAEHLWPIDEWWDFHAGGGAFKNLKVFTEAMNQRYGSAAGAEEYALKAQVLAYEAHRAMFEAFGRNKYGSTGLIQWMLNNAWPSMIWHLYDFYLRPGGTYFAAKRGCEPLHIQYSYDDASVVVVNSYRRPFDNLQARVRVFNLDMSPRLDQAAVVAVAPDSVTKALTLPTIAELSATYFLRLDLTGADAKTLSSNFYWLSTKPDVLNEAKSTWYYTPQSSFADFGALQQLPKVALKGACRSSSKEGETSVRVAVENPSQSLAFFVRLKLNRVTDHEEVLPVRWEDNYFSLLPGEKRDIAALLRRPDVAGAKLELEIGGWNVEPTVVGAK